jgi:hypothetical protein
MTGDLSKATASTGAATPASSAGAHGVPTQPTVLPTPTPYVAPTPTPYVAPTPTPYVAPTPTPTPYVPPTPPPPAAPTGLTATATGPNSVVLTWNGSSGATGYVISNGSAELATVGGGTTTYTVGGLAAGTYMCFAVRAYNAAESSGWTPHACTSTATPPPTATPTPQPTPTPAPVCNVDATLAMSPSTSHANNGQDVTISIVLNTGDWYPVTSADLSIGTGTTNLQLDDPAWSDSVDSGGGDNHTYTRHVSVNAPRGVATVIATVRFKMISAVAVSQRVWWNSASIQSSSGCSGYPLTNISTWPDASVQNY